MDRRTLPPTRRTLLGMTIGGAALARPALVRAQGFPARPVTLIVPFSAGGTTDVAMRALAERASSYLGQSIVIENRTGAGASLGAAAVARARPDGYLLTQMMAPVVRLQILQQMPYEVPRDFSAIINLNGYAFGIVVGAASPWRSWADLVADARRRPGAINVGHTGTFGTLHLGMEELARRENIQFTQVAFRGEAESLPALLGGHIDVAAVATAGGGAMVEEGRARWLNVWTAQRLRRFPEVPTLVELGYEGMVVTSPYGLVGPAGMDSAVMRRLHDAFKRAMFDPGYVAMLARFDMENDYKGSEDYAVALQQMVAREREMLQRLAPRRG